MRWQYNSWGDTYNATSLVQKDRLCLAVLGIGVVGETVDSAMEEIIIVTVLHLIEKKVLWRGGEELQGY